MIDDNTRGSVGVLECSRLLPWYVLQKMKHARCAAAALFALLLYARVLLANETILAVYYLLKNKPATVMYVHVVAIKGLTFLRLLLGIGNMIELLL
jgi:hypothetical protein